MSSSPPLRDHHHAAPALRVPQSKSVSDGQKFSYAEGFGFVKNVPGRVLHGRIRVERAVEGFAIVLCRGKYLTNDILLVSLRISAPRILQCNISCMFTRCREDTPPKGKAPLEIYGILA